VLFGGLPVAESGGSGGGGWFVGGVLGGVLNTNLRSQINGLQLLKLLITSGRILQYPLMKVNGNIYFVLNQFLGTVDYHHFLVYSIVHRIMFKQLLILFYFEV
jgi:hypothetical protein